MISDPGHFYPVDDVKSSEISESTEMKYWYALHVRSRHEKKVATLLEQKQIEVSLPLVQVIRQWSDRKKLMQEPLFRGYVFTRISFQYSRFQVLETHGAVRFAGIGKRITPIPDVQMYWLDTALREIQDVQLAKAFPIGRHVKVISGPLRGIEGVVQYTSSTSRLVVWFDALMQGLAINIDASMIEPIN